MGGLQQFTETYVVPLQLMLAMAGMGATLAPTDFLAVLKSPQELTLGIAYQLVLVPALAVAFTLVLDLGPGWSVGLILVAACPGGATSNLLTYLARGNLPLSISLTTVVTLGSLLTIPTLLSLLAAQHLPAGFSPPIAEILFSIVVYLLVPLAFGMVLHRVASWARTFSSWAVRASVILVLFIAISSMGTGRIEPFAHGWAPPLTVLAFALVLATSAPLLSRALRREEPDTVALTIEVTVRNVAIALLLVFFFFDGQEEQGHVLYTILLYSGVSGPATLPILFLHRWTGRAVPFGTPIKAREGAAARSSRRDG